jgi:hypothetical protein
LLANAAGNQERLLLRNLIDDARHDAVLRSRNGSAPQPAATALNTATQNRWSELKNG